jgi:hypothetical protein
MLIEFDAFAHQSIEVRGANRSPMPADVVPAQIVGHDEQDVWGCRANNGRRHDAHWTAK